jgi:hypothetical protein
MPTIAEIRAQYPYPVSLRDYDPPDDDPIRCYCVGGAICLAHPGIAAAVCGLNEDEWHFPGEYDLATVLMALNPDLNDPVMADIEDTKAFRYAWAIIESGDLYRYFDEAWRLAEEALAYRRPQK